MSGFCMGSNPCVSQCVKHKYLQMVKKSSSEASIENVTHLLISSVTIGLSPKHYNT